MESIEKIENQLKALKEYLRKSENNIETTSTADKGNNDEFSSLTKRELECLTLLSKGNTAKMVARILYLSPRTVERHIQAIKEKLKARYKPELIKKYIEWKFLQG